MVGRRASERSSNCSGEVSLCRGRRLVRGQKGVELENADVQVGDEAPEKGTGRQMGDLDDILRIGPNVCGTDQSLDQVERGGGEDESRYERRLNRVAAH